MKNDETTSNKGNITETTIISKRYNDKASRKTNAIIIPAVKGIKILIKGYLNQFIISCRFKAQVTTFYNSYNIDIQYFMLIFIKI